jgi:hypothetical protein
MIRVTMVVILTGGIGGPAGASAGDLPSVPISHVSAISAARR